MKRTVTEIRMVNAILDEVLDGNEEHVIANWKKWNLCCKVAKNLVELCPCSSVLWKVGLVDNELNV